MTEPRHGSRTPSRFAPWWTTAAAATAAWGSFAAFRQLPWQSLVAVLLASGLLTASLALSADAVGSDRVDLTRAARFGLLTGVAVVVTIGLVNAVGPLGVALVVALLLTWPSLRERVRAWVARRVEAAVVRRTRQDDPETTTDHRAAWWEDALVEGRDDAWDRTVPGSLATEPDPAGGALPPAPLDTAPDWSPTLTVPTHLSDHDLCLAWESSSRALRRCTTTSARLEVVRVRQACLDELERRQPDAVRAWVLAGADPESSPARYLAS